MVANNITWPTVSYLLYGCYSTIEPITSLQMERQKAKIIELPELEMEILRLCIFPETFESIAAECTSEKKQSVIADAIKNLIHTKLLLADNSANSLAWIYDVDKMKESSFRATANGVEWMEENGVG